MTSRWGTWGLAVALATALACGAPAAHADAALDYVALGDSYSAASGVLPPDPQAAPECLRSTRNYPHVLAARLHATLTDVTCGGAETKDYASGQYPGVAPQLDALGAKTQLVTMTIGGNDGNVFIGSILACGSLGTASLGQGSPCQDRFGSSFEDTVRQSTYPALVQALTAVHAKAPNARVLILGYPSILPPSGGCYPQMPVAAGDVPYLDRLQATLNDAVGRAAAATGTTFVDLAGPSAGHDACQAPGTRWIEPVVAGTNPVIVHPNALGETALADAAQRALTAAGPAASGAPALALTRRVLPGRRLRLGCRVSGTAPRPCRVTVAVRRGSRLRTLRTVTVAPGRTRTIRTGAARRLVLTARVTTADGAKLSARRTLRRA